jgi:hypothetical protein
VSFLQICDYRLEPRPFISLPIDRWALPRNGHLALVEDIGRFVGVGSKIASRGLPRTEFCSRARLLFAVASYRTREYFSPLEISANAFLSKGP